MTIRRGVSDGEHHPSRSHKLNLFFLFTVNLIFQSSHFAKEISVCKSGKNNFILAFPDRQGHNVLFCPPFAWPAQTASRPTPPLSSFKNLTIQIENRHKNKIVSLLFLTSRYIIFYSLPACLDGFKAHSTLPLSNWTLPLLTNYVKNIASLLFQTSRDTLFYSVPPRPGLPGRLRGPPQAEPLPPPGARPHDLGGRCQRLHVR